VRCQEDKEDVLVQKIRIVLANCAHLDRVVNEEFHRSRRQRLQQEETAGQAVSALSALANSATSPVAGSGVMAVQGLTASAEPSLTFNATVDLACSMLRRIELPFERDMVHSWVAAACSTFAYSRAEADLVTSSRVRFVVDWVLRCLADQMIQRVPEKYFRRQFVTGVCHETALSDSGIVLTGQCAHGLFGNIWLHARTKKTWAERRASQARHSLHTAFTRQISGGSMDRDRFASDLSRSTRSPTPQDERPISPDMRGDRNTPTPPAGGHHKGRHVVISVSKSLCRLPPEIMSRRLMEMMEMEPLPYVLPLVDAYEDLEHIHLVYAPLAGQAICLVDHVFDIMHRNSSDREGNSRFCERTVQEIVWKLMSMLKQAHSRGLVHGCLRIGACYLDDAESLDSLRILEFGLFQLFHLPRAGPPMAVLMPLELDFMDPVPPYRRDFQCIAEMLYLLLGGQPLCPPDSSVEHRRQRFRCGAAAFADKVYSRTSESAKAFCLELLKPAQFHKGTKKPSHLATIHMTHRWFHPPPEAMSQLDDQYDVIVMRRYDTWRNTLRLQMNLVKLVADRMALESISRLRQELSSIESEKGCVSWVQLEQKLATLSLIPSDLLKKVNKAFGDNTLTQNIPIEDFCKLSSAWRQSRVRGILWQVFSRSKSLNGRISADSCMEGLTSGVIHVWSRPSRVLEIIFPLKPGFQDSGESDHKAKVEELIGNSKHVSYLELLAKTDARISCPITDSQRAVAGP